MSLHGRIGWARPHLWLFQISVDPPTFNILMWLTSTSTILWSILIKSRIGVLSHQKKRKDTNLRVMLIQKNNKGMRMMLILPSWKFWFLKAGFVLLLGLKNMPLRGPQDPNHITSADPSLPPPQLTKEDGLETCNGGLSALAHTHTPKDLANLLAFPLSLLANAHFFIFLWGGHAWLEGNRALSTPRRGRQAGLKREGPLVSNAFLNMKRVSL